MNAHTKISAKGQIVIPKAVRERLQWVEGEALEIEEIAGGLVLRLSPRPRERITVEEFLRRVPPYDGPTVSLEEMDEAVEREAVRRWKDFERRNR